MGIMIARGNFHGNATWLCEKSKTFHRVPEMGKSLITKGWETLAQAIVPLDTMQQFILAKLDHEASHLKRPSTNPLSLSAATIALTTQLHVNFALRPCGRIFLQSPGPIAGSVPASAPVVA